MQHVSAAAGCIIGRVQPATKMRLPTTCSYGTAGARATSPAAARRSSTPASTTVCSGIVYADIRRQLLRAALLVDCDGAAGRVADMLHANELCSFDIEAHCRFVTMDPTSQPVLANLTLPLGACVTIVEGPSMARVK